MPLKDRIKLPLKVLALLGLRLLFRARKRLAGHGPALPGEPASILVIETAFLGDVAAATPLIRQLHERLPQARLYALVQRRWQALLQDHPLLAGLELIDSFRPREMARVIARLRPREYQAVICTSPGVKNSLLALLIGQGLVMGYLARYTRAPHYYQDHPVDVIGGQGQWRYGKDQHIVSRARLAAAPLLGPAGPPSPPEIHLDPGREREMRQRLQEEGLLREGCLNLVVHPGASLPERRWPPASLVEVLNRLGRQPGRRLNIILTGLGGERGLCQDIAGQLEGGARLFLDRGLDELCVLIKHAQVFLGGDSGPKFLADAFAKPMVVLHGPQLPGTVGPLNPRAVSLYRQIQCNPCPQVACPHQGQCVRAIGPDEVLQALRGRLDSLD